MKYIYRIIAVVKFSPSNVRFVNEEFQIVTREKSQAAAEAVWRRLYGDTYILHHFRHVDFIKETT